MERKLSGRLNGQREKVREPAMPWPHRANEGELGPIPFQREEDLWDDQVQRKGVEESRLPAEMEDVRQRARLRPPRKQNRWHFQLSLVANRSIVRTPQTAKRVWKMLVFMEHLCLNKEFLQRWSAR